MGSYLIRRDDGISDDIAGEVFDSYDAAYAVVERYYADICCSDDREYYRIEVLTEELPGSPQLAPMVKPFRDRLACQVPSSPSLGTTVTRCP